MRLGERLKYPIDGCPADANGTVRRVRLWLDEFSKNVGPLMVIGCLPAGTL
jgi:hypothetical protein